MKEHLSQLTNNKHDNRFLQSVYTKYKNFEYRILGEFNTRQEAYTYEQQLLIEFFKEPFYTMLNAKAIGGDGASSKKPENRKKTSERMKASNPMSSSQTRIKLSEIKKEAWAAGVYSDRVAHSTESFKKQSESLKKFYASNPKNQSGANNPCAKAILNTETGEVYDTGVEAAKALGLKPAWISTLAKRGVKLKFV